MHARLDRRRARDAECDGCVTITPSRRAAECEPYAKRLVLCPRDACARALAVTLRCTQCPRRANRELCRDYWRVAVGSGVRRCALPVQPGCVARLGMGEASMSTHLL